MAILQEANAVFYHPLDDSVENLKAVSWSGQAAFAPGTVSTALLTGAGDSIGGFGLETEFSTVAMNSNEIIALSATMFVVVYREASSTQGIAKVGVVSGTDITFGVGTFFAFNNGEIAAASLLPSTKFVVSYKTSGGANGTRIGTIVGTDITFGVEKLLAGVGQSSATVAALSDTAFVLAYRDLTTSPNGRGTASIGIVSGTDITYGTKSIWSSGIGTISEIEVAILSATTFAVVYEDEFDSGHGTARLGTVTGTTIVFGLEAEFASAAETASNVSTSPVSPTKFVVAWRAFDGTGWSAVGTVVLTSIVFAPSTQFSAGIVIGTQMATITASKIVIIYAVGGNGRSIVGNISGTSITFGAESEFRSGSISQKSVAALSETRFVVSYEDISDANLGTAKVGTLETVLTGQTSFGAETEFVADTESWMFISSFSSTKFVVAYSDNVDSSRGKARIGTVIGTSVTFGTPAQFTAGVLSGVSVVVLDATKIVVAWQETTTSDSKVGTVTGTSIVFATAAPFIAGGTSDIYATTLSAGQFIVVYRAAGPERTEVKVGTVVGSDITFGTATEVVGGAATAFLSVITLSTTKFVVAYRVVAGGGLARVGDVTGTSIVLGVAVAVAGSAITDMSITAISETKFIAAYVETAPAQNSARVGTIASGTIITFGAPAEFKSPGAVFAVHATTVSVDRFVVAYTDSDSPFHAFVVTGTVVGTAIVFGVGEKFLAANFSGSNRVVSLLGAGKFVVAYKDESGALNRGAVRVGSAGGYQTVVSANRLAFSSWTKSPNVVAPVTTVPPTTTVP